MSFNHVRALACISLVTLATASAACSGAGDEETVSPRIVLVDRTKQALTSGELTSINGTYGPGCTGRSNTAWSARISGSDPMSNPDLRVVKDNVGCDLTVTDLVTTQRFSALAPITMTASYGNASAFVDPAGGPPAFYANAKLDSVLFASTFALTILFSDNLNDASPPPIDATDASLSSMSNEGVLVPAPDYALNTGTLAIATDGVTTVVSATGEIGLTAGTHPGESFVVTGAIGTSFAEVDQMYRMFGAPAALEASIPASALMLQGEMLPTVRTVIIAHEASGVRSYQVTRLTFNNPS